MREPDFFKAKRIIWEATAQEMIGIEGHKYEESEDDIKDREWLAKFMADNEEINAELKETALPRYKKVKKNSERYGDDIRYPSLILVMGTQEQAEWAAKQLSNYHAGCEYYYYYDGENG